MNDPDKIIKKLKMTEHREGGFFSERKVKSFLDYIKKEKEIIKRDLYETKILEKLELDLKKYKKARKKALENISDTESPVLRAYVEYLIPKLEILLDVIKSGGTDDECEKIVSDFLRGYNPFFVPNAHRNLWPKDLDLSHNVKKMFSTYKLTK